MVNKVKKNISCLLIVTIFSCNLACYADIKNYVDISFNKVSLDSKLYNEYNAYQYVIKNNGDEDLELIKAYINGTDGGLAYQTIADDEHPLQKLWIVCGPVGLFTLGFGWVVGILATPFVIIVSNDNKTKMREEANNYTTFINSGVIKKGDSINVGILVPLGAIPHLKLIFKDKEDKTVT